VSGRCVYRKTHTCTTVEYGVLFLCVVIIYSCCIYIIKKKKIRYEYGGAHEKMCPALVLWIYYIIGMWFFVVFLLLIFCLFVCRPGVWARSLCINDTVHTGSMLPFVGKAKYLGYSVLILNPNQRMTAVATDATSGSSRLVCVRNSLFFIILIRLLL